MIISVNWLKKFVPDLPEIDELSKLIGARLVEIESIENLNEKYKDVLNYIIDMGCDYYFEYLPLKRLGLPVPPTSSKEQGLEV